MGESTDEERTFFSSTTGHIAMSDSTHVVRRTEEGRHTVDTFSQLIIVDILPTDQRERLPVHIDALCNQHTGSEGFMPMQTPHRTNRPLTLQHHIATVINCTTVLDTLITDFETDRMDARSISATITDYNITQQGWLIYYGSDALPRYRKTHAYRPEGHADHRILSVLLMLTAGPDAPTNSRGWREDRISAWLAYYEQRPILLPKPGAQVGARRHARVRTE
jgi:hypothetical protein